MHTGGHGADWFVTDAVVEALFVRGFGPRIKQQRECALALKALGSHNNVVTHAVEINRLENEADRAHQEAVRRLFEDERDPLLVIKWKETLDFLEDATDRCEDVANVLEGVMVKHG